MNYCVPQEFLHSNRNLRVLIRPAAKRHLDVVLWHQSTADLMWSRTRAYPGEDLLTRTAFVARACLQETSCQKKYSEHSIPNEANKKTWMYAKEYVTTELLRSYTIRNNARMKQGKRSISSLICNLWSFWNLLQVLRVALAILRRKKKNTIQNNIISSWRLSAKEEPIFSI